MRTSSIQSSLYCLNLVQFLKSRCWGKNLFTKANRKKKGTKVRKAEGKRSFYNNKWLRHASKFDIIKSKITWVSHLKGPGRINAMNKSIKLKLKQWAINPIFLFIILGRNANICSECNVQSLIHKIFIMVSCFSVILKWK